jgi:putative addiction module component (TIGR02574 family)
MGSSRDSISAVPDALPLTQWQKDELDRRLAEFEADPDSGLTLEEVFARIRRAPLAFHVSSSKGGHRRLIFMSELDVAKEKIAYLKVWLGVLLVTDISTFGWLVSNVETGGTLLLWAAVIVVVALTIGILLLHRRIDRQIQSLKEL